MCSREEEAPVDGALSEVKTKGAISLDSTCKKCREHKSVLNLRTSDTYCKSCFLTTCQHRFRSTLGKHKIMRPGDQVLVGFSGNQGSVFLMQCLFLGYQEDVQKKLLFSSSVLLVDELGPFVDDPEERMKTLECFKEVLEHYGLEYYIVPLEVALKEEVDKGDIQSGRQPYQLPSESKQQELSEIFKSIKELSAKEDLIRNLKQGLLVSCARALEINKIFLAESQTSVAVNLMSGVSMGRGLHVSNDMAFLDNRFEDVQIIRPLRELSRKEIALANFYHNAPKPVIAPSFTALKDPCCSIEKIVEDFLTGLQDNFPATIPTVFRTGGKLEQTKGDQEEEGQINKDSTCILCYGQLKRDIEESNAVEASAFSRFLSEKGPLHFTDEDLSSDAIIKMKFGRKSTKSQERVNKLSVECGTRSESCGGDGQCAEGGGCSSRKEANKELELDDVEPFLCYSCRMTVGKAKTLPRVLQGRAEMRIRRLHMKEDIADFLL
ncbi:cytoplasmic tRNA 2-thiolation protein 2-like [Tigriopus californicus]|uniref:cytoplasmic tRNA 2-thiolation protein 2-like n=1 Tax=Tigriopus californicus TaxID=6832 RepID=UPI0027DA9331|nr:cytoplasmic tRNA 2-thiolation protein 2-like [Tigriopus californicus]